jgi:hypothetical protein
MIRLFSLLSTKVARKAQRKGKRCHSTAFQFGKPALLVRRSTFCSASIVATTCLSRKKLRLATKQLQEDIEKTSAEIRSSNRSNLNETGVERAVMQMWEQKIDDHAGKCYEIFCHHWDLRAEKKTSAFVRVALDLLLPRIKRLGQSAAHEASRRHIARGTIGTSPAQWYEASALAICGRWKEKLDIEARDLDVVAASSRAPRANPLFGMQGTGGSTSVRGMWTPLRTAGAQAREMLITAAAEKWGVDKAVCRAEDGQVIHTQTKERLSYGSLAEAAGKLPVPNDVKLKDPKQFRIVGKEMKRLDSPDKTCGRAEFGIDVRQPGMLHAVVARCPVIGGEVASFNADKAKTVRGVKHAVQISSGVAVVADNTWSAMQGRDALEIKWEEGPNASLTSTAIRKMLEEGASKPGGAVARKEGDVTAGLASAAKKIEAVYQAAAARASEEAGWSLKTQSSLWGTP